MSFILIHQLIAAMHMVQHMHLGRASLPHVWVGCTKGWHDTCDMTTITYKPHEIIVKW